MADDVLHVMVEKGLLEDAAMNSKAVLIHFYWRPTTKDNVSNWIKSTWNIRRIVMIEKKGRYSYLLAFHSHEDYNNVLKEEWVWYGLILARITAWRTSLEKGANLTNISIWVNFPNFSR